MGRSSGKLMAIILISSMLAGVSANAVELEENVITESVAEGVTIDENIDEAATREVDWVEGAVCEKEEVGVIGTEYTEGAANSESVMEEIGEDDGVVSYGGNDAVSSDSVPERGRI